MSARATIQGFYGADAPNPLSDLLDRYRNEVLREAAEKIRRDELCTKPYHRDYFADLIDPDRDAS